MLHSRFFKNYYPIKNVSDLFHMPQKDREILSKWLKTIQSDIDKYNYKSLINANKCGMNTCRQICMTYDKNTLLLAEKVCKISRFSFEIDEKDIDFINDVIYRHKYIWFISSYFFPINRTTNVEHTEAFMEKMKGKR